ncbi:MAG: UDP-N-acetylmuramate dehydrogenase [Deltaproteobacteria bacterium]|nr:UDP-N-acetylmuramate dehydrogenase [Deltaproteobacteria bacterium]
MKDVHLVGVGGTGMGAFAGLLKAAGYRVTGSDTALYPPMSDKLRDWGIPTMEGYRAENLEVDGKRPDLVIIGNVIRKDNPEATRAREGGFNQASFPQALGELFLRARPSVVIAGTHGKTTTTAMTAHALHEAGLDPGMLVGGVPRGFGESFRVGAPGAPFVVEGDEYDTAYWDKGPKFLHYRPTVLVTTSIEYDHADIYPDVESIERRFHEVAALLPPAGHLVAWAGSDRVRRVAEAVAARGVAVTSYGPGGVLVAADAVEDEQGVRFRVLRDGGEEARVALRLNGAHNVDNALAAYAVLRHFGVAADAAARALGTFTGVKRRLEEVGEARGVLVVDDFAHHPTAVRVTVDAARKRYAGRLHARGGRLWGVFEPRSATSCRKVFQEDYARAFDGADRIVIAEPGRKGTIPEAELFDVHQLVADMRMRGLDAVVWPTADHIAREVAAHAHDGDVVLVMSNGSFGGVHGKLLEALR